MKLLIFASLFTTAAAAYCSKAHPCGPSGRVDRLCNFDYGSHRCCEECPLRSYCFDQGLPSNGVDDCRAKCINRVECGMWYSRSSFMCANGDFCNFDHGDHGFVESCDSIEYCVSAGLPYKGERQCKRNC
mmetsp:Transcript_27175/g.32125  ORF Transcript_27175/g.32125 Transcript_27175/m.32125 type:complete len:130 (+) Transcript_27175:48-437(+)